MIYGTGPEQTLPWQEDIERLAHHARTGGVDQEGLTSLVQDRVAYLVKIGYLCGIAGGLSLEEISGGLVEKAQIVYEQEASARR
jgi:hypothetical protein